MWHFLSRLVAERFRVLEKILTSIMGSVRLIGNFIIIIIVISFASVALASRHHHHHHRNSRTSKQRLSTPEECARPCVEGKKPKTCYYHFTVEYYSTMSRACDLCRSNTTTRLTEDCQCITADGYEKAGIITVNRMYPGPAIMVCLHDYVVVDVENHVPGNGLTIHWHGVLQNGYQYYDGVPHVTQCPIQEGTTFRYQWRANNPGSHFWHAHTGFHKAEGLEGSLIIREPETTEPNSDLWDFDDNDNVIFLTDWLHSAATERFPGTRRRMPGQRPDNLLINGMGRWTDPTTNISTETPLATLTVKKGYRYRFRMINSCSLACPVLLSIEGHNLTVIASDGENLEPFVVDSIASLSAERYDFIINTDQPTDNYWIQLRALGQCASRNLQQLGILRYASAPTKIDESEQPTYGRGVETGVVLNQLNVNCNGIGNPPNTVCVSNLQSARRVSKRILSEEPDIKLYLPIGFYDYPAERLFQSGLYRRFLVAGGDETAGLLANISNVSPASPLLTQRGDIPEEEICSSKNLPEKCKYTRPCECTHVEELPLGALIEIVLVDEAQIENLSHPFHLHGHSFHIIGEGCASEHNLKKININNVMDLDMRGKMKRHLKRPPAKDTYAVPNNGYTIIRFIANNPGYWLFHCHFLFHLVAGMTLTFHVGKTSDLPPIPRGFPQCGDFTPSVRS